MSKIWNEGADAYFMSLTLASCPYVSGSEEAKHWTMGFCQARYYSERGAA